MKKFRSLRIESLEDRKVAAGNVFADVANGVLSITGDASSNQIEIYQNSRGDTVIQNEGDNTTVNKRNSIVVSERYDTIQIDLANGNDYVYAHNLKVAWDVTVDLGHGDDAAMISSLTTGDDLVIYATEGGNRNWIANSLDDYIIVTNSQIGSASIRNNDLIVKGGSDNQYLYIDNVTVGDDVYLDLTTRDSGDYDQVQLNLLSAQGDSSTGYMRVQAREVVADNVNADDEMRFYHVRSLDLDWATAKERIYIAGTAYGDEIRGTHLISNNLLEIHGYGGDDWIDIHTRSNNTQVYGDGGEDTIYTLAPYGPNYHFVTIYGGADDDGMFAEGRFNFVYGQGGDDRFLVKKGREYDARDDDDNDAIITFENTNNNTEINAAGFSDEDDPTYAPGSWTPEEIKHIDVALANLHDHIGNTTLLKKVSGSTINFRRLGAQIEGDQTFNGFNGSSAISLTDDGLAQEDWALWKTVYHEIGHNWDDPSENEHIDQFRALSGWVQSDDSPGADYVASGGSGDDWWHLDDAEFARNYGKFNPREDYATTFETYFLNEYHGDTHGRTIVQAKFDNLDLLFTDLRNA